MSPTGGIDARDLTSGNVTWKSLDAAKPLLAIGGKLVAQAAPAGHGVLTIVTLDARAGTVTGRTEIPLPPGLYALVADGPTRSFRAEAQPAADGGVVITWTAEDGRFQGALIPEVDVPVTDEAAAKRALAAATAAQQPWRGAARLDLGTGRSIAMDYEAAQRAAVRLPAIAKPALAKAAGGQQMTSANGKHVLSSERSEDGKLRKSYRWTITDAGGTAIGTLEAPVSMAPFVASGSRLFYVAMPAARQEDGKLIEEPLRLRALDLQTGAELWSAAVVDSTYRGPFPP
jgi:hypothetical protein